MLWFWAIIGSALTATGADNASSPASTVVFYDYDINQAAVSEIAETFESIFEQSKLDYTVVVTTQKSVFDQALRQSNVRYAILNGGFLDTYRDVFVPISVVRRDNSPYLRKQILRRRGRASRKLVVVASAGAWSIAAGREWVSRQIRKQDPAIGEVLVLGVSKDVDAGLSLFFEQADYAIMHQDTLDTMAKVSPAMAEVVGVTGETAPLVRPVLVRRATASTDAALEDVFLSMHETLHGQQLLYFLGVDDFVAYDAAMAGDRQPDAAP